MEIVHFTLTLCYLDYIVRGPRLSKVEKIKNNFQIYISNKTYINQKNASISKGDGGEVLFDEGGIEFLKSNQI